MTPEDAVARLAELVAARDEFTEDEIYDALEAAGLPDAIAHRAYVFTQTAWSRGMLEGMGVECSPEYAWFDADGTLLEAGQLAESPYYTAARQLSSQYANTRGYQLLVAMSAESNTLENAVQGGSRPADLVMGPAAFLAGSPTHAGMEKIQAYVVEKSRGAIAAGKPKAKSGWLARLASGVMSLVNPGPCRPESPPRDARESDPDSPEALTWGLLRMFQDHGAACHMHEGWVTADSGEFQAQARLFPTARTVQLDVECRTRDGKTIIESCAGFGGSRRESVADAINNFCQSSFHVLFAALTGRPCSHCELEEWEIHGRPWRVYLGPIFTRKSTPDGPMPAVHWFASMEEHLKQLRLEPGMHWIRMYHGEIEDSSPVDEVLFDNEPDEELQARFAALDWPPAEGFYSVRIFLMLVEKENAQS